MRYESKKQKIFSFLKYIILSFFSFPHSVYCPSCTYANPLACRVYWSWQMSLLSEGKSVFQTPFPADFCEETRGRVSDGVRSSVGSGGLRQEESGVCVLPAHGGASPAFISPNWLHPLKRLGIPWNTAKRFPTLNVLYLPWCWNGAGVVPRAGDLFSREFAVYIWSLSKSL